VLFSLSLGALPSDCFLALLGSVVFLLSLVAVVASFPPRRRPLLSIPEASTPERGHPLHPVNASPSHDAVCEAWRGVVAPPAWLWLDGRDAPADARAARSARH